jgi:hypothetical protein
MKNDCAMTLKNSSEKTIDGRSRKAIMAYALKLSGKPRIGGRPITNPVKDIWQ